MKKKALIMIVLIGMSIIGNITFKKKDSRVLGLSVANIEALASDAEASKRKKHDSHFGKTYIGGESKVYERAGVGDVCIVWHGYKALGDKTGTCYTVD